MTRSLWWLAAALALTACGSGASPSATVGDLTAVEQALALRGVTIVNAVGGDPGCSGSGLHDNAVRLDLRLAQEPVTSLYLFRWRRANQYDEAAQPFADCAASYAASAGEEVTTLEARPWRAFGAGWSDELRSTVESALRAAGGA